jgi:hypothetical protein
MYRILEEAGEVRERRDQLQHPQYQKPQLLANAPNVTAEVYSNTGQLVQTLIFTVPPKGWAQQAVTANITDGIVEWKTDNLIYAWAVNVDTRSNDGTLTYPTYYVP